MRALISDFGGVLTTPLSEGFLAYQEESGVSLEELGTAMRPRRRGSTASTRCSCSSGARSPRASSRAGSASTSQDGFDLARLRELYFERLEPTRR